MLSFKKPDPIHRSHHGIPSIYNFYKLTRAYLWKFGRAIWQIDRQLDG